MNEWEKIRLKLRLCEQIYAIFAGIKVVYLIFAGILDDQGCVSDHEEAYLRDYAI